MLMPCQGSNGLTLFDISFQSVHAVCEGVQAPHGKIETLCHGAQAVVVLSQDNMPPGMTSLEWRQAQLEDPAICQIIQAIQNKTLYKLKIKQDMIVDPSHSVCYNVVKVFSLNRINSLAERQAFAHCCELLQVWRKCFPCNLGKPKCMRKCLYL